MQNSDLQKPPPKIEAEQPSGIKRLQVFLRRLEDGTLIGMLGLVIALAVTQIILRNLFEAGIVWGDVLVRILVLWLGLLGAMVASRNNDHISIDVITRHLPERLRTGVNCILSLFTATVCMAAAYTSLEFVKMELSFGTKAFAGVPTGLCSAIIPFAFCVIALRFLIMFIAGMVKLIKPAL